MIKYLFNIIFTAWVYKIVQSSMPETDLKWLSLVMPLIVSTAVFYIQFIFSQALSSFPQLIWVSLKAVGIKTVLFLPIDYLSLNPGWFYSAMQTAAWITAIFTAIAPSSSKFSLFYYLKKVLNKKNTEVALNKSMEEVDKLGNNGKDFEEFMAAIYRKFGYSADSTTALRAQRRLPPSVLLRGGSGEQGVDVIVYFRSPRVIAGQEYTGLLVQCKQYSSTVGNKAIQEIFSAIPMYEKHYERKFKPVVVTNNYFTKQAKDLALTNGVMLVDRDLLSRLIADANKQEEEAA